MADLGVGNQLGNTVHHAQARPQDGNDADGLAGKHHHGRFADGGLNFHFFGGQIPRHLVYHQHGNFIQQLPEVLVARILVTHNAQFVLNQRMIEYMYLAHSFPP